MGIAASPGRSQFDPSALENQEESKKRDGEGEGALPVLKYSEQIIRFRPIMSK
jgi:hypothetical protein